MYKFISKGPPQKTSALIISHPETLEMEKNIFRKT